MLTVAMLLAATTGLAGCLGSGSGNGGGGGGTGGPLAFESNYDEASGKIPTSDMPSSIQADYVGQFKVGINGDPTTAVAGAGQNSEIVGDLNVAVDWTEGQTGNPFSGTAGNITVTDVVENTSETLTGELTVDQDIGVISVTEIPSMTVAGVTTPAARAGAFEFGLNGELSGSEGDVEATVLVGGNFTGSEGESMVGVVSGGFKEVGSTNPAIFDAGIGGVAYLNRE